MKQLLIILLISLPILAEKRPIPNEPLTSAHLDVDDSVCVKEGEWEYRLFYKNRGEENEGQCGIIYHNDTSIVHTLRPQFRKAQWTPFGYFQYVEKIKMFQPFDGKKVGFFHEDSLVFPEVILMDTILNDSAEYVLVGESYQNTMFLPRKSAIQERFISNVEALKNFKERWIVSKKRNYCACFADYFIRLYRDGVMVSSFDVHFKTGQIRGHKMEPEIVSDISYIMEKPWTYETYVQDSLFYASIQNKIARRKGNISQYFMEVKRDSLFGGFFTMKSDRHTLDKANTVQRKRALRKAVSPYIEFQHYIILDEKRIIHTIQDSDTVIFTIESSKEFYDSFEWEELGFFQISPYNYKIKAFFSEDPLIPGAKQVD